MMIAFASESTFFGMKLLPFEILLKTKSDF